MEMTADFILHLVIKDSIDKVVKMTTMKGWLSRFGLKFKVFFLRIYIFISDFVLKKNFVFKSYQTRYLGTSLVELVMSKQFGIFSSHLVELVVFKSSLNIFSSALQTFILTLLHKVLHCIVFIGSRFHLFS